MRTIALDRNAFVANRREAKYGIFGVFKPFLHLSKVFDYEEFNCAMEYLPKNYLTAYKRMTMSAE